MTQAAFWRIINCRVIMMIMNIIIIIRQYAKTVLYLPGRGPHTFSVFLTPPPSVALKNSSRTKQHKNNKYFERNFMSLKLLAT